MTMRRFVALPLLAIGAAACSHYEIPASHVTAPSTSIQNAQAAGAHTTNPESAARLQMAKDELAAARQLDRSGKKRSADLMYLRADTDARIASSGAYERAVTDEARSIQEQIHAIQTPQAPSR